MKIWGIGQISPEERNDILSKHKEIYNGFKSYYPNVSNTQPLYVQDFANDKEGLVVNNRGEVKKYTNVGINEQVESKEVCDECGSMMMEGECSECGWKGEVGAMEEQSKFDDEMEDSEMEFDTPEEIKIDKSDIKKVFRPGVDLGKSFDKFKGMLDMDEELEEDECVECGGEMMEGECSECGGMMSEGECTECGYKMEEIDEETGHLDDIYKVEDLDLTDGDFDYVEGGGNKYGTFEKMHHMKEEYEDTDNEDDGFEDIESGEEEMYEQGGNADDMDVDDVKPAYDFESNGPMAGGDVYPVNEDGDCLDCYETMESAWADDELEENDISGVQGIYGDMKPAYDFDSEGPGSAGPYQRSSWSEQYDGEDEDVYWEKDLEDDELDLDLTKFNPEDKSWEEITAHTGEDEFSNLEEDLKESFLSQKNKISEMFVRMKVIK